MAGVLTHRAGLIKPAALVPATVSFRGFSSDYGTAGASKTWTAFDIGAAAADRIVVVVAHYRNIITRTISSCTIGGNAATALTASLNADGSIRAGVRFFALAVPAGTTADIAVTMSNTTQAFTIAVYAVYGAVLPVFSTDDSGALSGSTLTATVDAPDGSCVIAAAASDSGSSVSWAGVDEAYDDVVNGSNNLFLVGGAKIMNAADATYDAVVTYSGTLPTRYGMGAVVLEAA